MKYSETLISSNTKEGTTGAPGATRPNTTKVLIYLDAVRATAWILPEEHPDHTPDTFEVIKYWVDPSKITSKIDEEFLDSVSNSSIVELRFGTYETTPISSKKRIVKQ